MAALTAEQEEQLTLFQEVTALQDRQQAITVSQLEQSTIVIVLTMSNWNTERAVDLHMSGAMAGTEAQAPAPPPAARNNAAAAETISDTASTTTQGQSRGFWGTIGHVIGKVAGAVGGFLQSVIAADDGPRETFKDYYERKYGERHPRFFEGTLGQAVSKAKNDVKLVCVYLHCDTSSYTDDLCQGPFKNEDIIETMNRDYVFWGGDTATRAVYDLAAKLQIRSYPFVGIILPTNSSQLQVLQKVEGTPTTSVDSVMAMLIAGQADLEQHRHELGAAAATLVENRIIREEQDREYQEALAKDRELEAQRRLEEENRKKAEEEEREAFEKARLEEEQREASRKELAGKLVKAERGPGTARVQVRFPNGQRANRIFSAEHTLQHLYDWVEACEYAENNPSLKAPRKFLLKTTFPSAELQATSDITMKDAQLVPDAVVVIENLSDDDD